MSNDTEYKVHHAAELFPMMAPEELGKLAADIKANGQRTRIAYFDGQLLDGRNRLEACKLAGVEPRIANFNLSEIGGDPLAYVLSVNLHRRHLTESQRAMVSTECEKLFAAEAKERQRDAGGGKGPLVATVPQALAEREPSARDKAAAALGISGRTVTAAKRVIADGAEPVAAAVRDGRLSVSVAEKLVRIVPDKKRQEKIIENGVVSSTVRVNDTRVKRDISAAQYRNDLQKTPSSAPPPRKGTRNGVIKGNEAIDILKGIYPSDEQYVRGHQVVYDYIRHNVKLVVPPYQPEGDFEDVSVEENAKRWETLLHAITKVSKLAAAMAEDGILTDERMRAADKHSTAHILGDAIESLPILHLVVDVACEAGGPL